MAERVEMSRRNVVVDGKVYSVKRESEPVFLLRLSDLSVRYLVVIADAIDFHGFQRLHAPAGEHERVAGFRQRLGGGLSDARACAGDEGDFVPVTHCSRLMHAWSRRRRAER